jgi:RNA polymerase sigma-70 factor (ECF subfamily)
MGGRKGTDTGEFEPWSQDSPLADPAVQIEDNSLAQRAKAGERTAFAQLYEQHRAPAFGYFRARVLTSHDAEDLTQEVFVRAFTAISRYNTEMRFQPWLIGICRNVLREHVRKVKRRSEVGWTELCLELEGLIDDESIYDDVLHILPVCLSTLSEPSSQALHWHYMGGMKIQQIADRMTRTLGAVKVLMVRARQALKRCIKSQIESKGK